MLSSSWTFQWEECWLTTSCTQSKFLSIPFAPRHAALGTPHAVPFTPCIHLTNDSLYVSAYGESISISGLHYIAICTGTISGSQLCGPLMEFLYKRLAARNGNTYVPELRIPLLLPGVLATPIGLLLYGWAAEHHLF